MDVTNELIFLAQVGTIISFIGALFILYRVLVQTKDSTIELLKERCTYLKDKIADLESKAPDILVTVMESRMQSLEIELEKVSQDISSSDESVEEKKIELSIVRDKYNEAQYYAFYDQLTGLLNRARFNIESERLIKSAIVSNKNIALLYIDINKFKLINDEYGHSVGDQLLIDCAARFVNVLGQNILLARMGGDEFVAMLEYTDLANITLTVEKMCKAIRTPFFINDIEITTAGSIGISLYPENGSTPADLLEEADIALYKSKGNDLDYMFANTWVNDIISSTII